jgi:hypothetical protein
VFLSASNILALNSQLISYDSPGNIEPGTQTTITIKMKNTGNEIWQKGLTKLGSTRSNYNTRWGIPYINLTITPAIKYA